MAYRWSFADLARLKPEARNKYGAIPTVYNGRRYPSKLQARCAAWLDLRQRAGEILWYIEEVPFRLPGGLIHRIDFLAMLNQGYELIEAKGRDHPLGKLKRKQVEQLYGVSIRLFTARDLR